MAAKLTHDQQVMLNRANSGHHLRDFLAPRRKVLRVEVGQEGPDLLLTVHLQTGGSELWRVAPDGAARAV